MTRQSVGVAMHRAGDFVASRPDWLIERIARLPSTNLRVFVTLLLALTTAGHYYTSSWRPSTEWLGFILGLSGLDLAQFHSKRRTWVPQNGEADAALPHQDTSPEGSDRAV